MEPSDDDLSLVCPRNGSEYFSGSPATVVAIISLINTECSLFTTFKSSTSGSEYNRVFLL